MMRKFVFSLFFLFFMLILATCSMVKEQAPVAGVANPPAAVALTSTIIDE